MTTCESEYMSLHIYFMNAEINHIFFFFLLNLLYHGFIITVVRREYMGMPKMGRRFKKT